MTFHDLACVGNTNIEFTLPMVSLTDDDAVTEAAQLFKIVDQVSCLTGFSAGSDVLNENWYAQRAFAADSGVLIERQVFWRTSAYDPVMT